MLSILQNYDYLQSLLRNCDIAQTLAVFVMRVDMSPFSGPPSISRPSHSSQYQCALEVPYDVVQEPTFRPKLGART